MVKVLAFMGELIEVLIQKSRERVAAFLVLELGSILG
jgi:hypothetical protein